MKENKITIKFAVILFLLCGLSFIQYSCVPAEKAKRPRVAVKQCLDCHPEYKTRFSTGTIHSPVKDESCYACHRPHGLYGKIVFRAQQPMMCYACHENVQPQEAAKSIHEPVRVDNCTVCHDSHNSEYANLLKADGDAICFACHEQKPFQRKFIHQPLEDGCSTCHDPHSTINVSLLKQDQDLTCKSCHSVDELGFMKAHFAYPVTSGCIQCHTPHSSTGKGLLKKNVHEPVRTGECDSCHTVDRNKNIKTRAKADSLCGECHDIHLEANSVHKPYVQGQCTSCHDVHASDHNDLFAEAPEKICLNCHAAAMSLNQSTETEDKNNDEKEKPAYKPVSRHQPVTDGKCLDCHNGHTSKYNGMLSQDLETLCYKCHQQSGYSRPSGSHPTSKEQNCETCHVPHDSPVKSLLKGNTERELCFECHKKTASERGKFSLHKPFSRGECGKCHQLHRPAESRYLSKSYATGELCLTCHETAGRGGENHKVHAPVSRGQCKKCHSPHAADNEYVMLLPDGEQCYICHQDVKRTVAGKKMKHQPVEAGKCTSCHSAHGSSQKGILKKNQPAICITCHIDVAKNWLDGYPHKPALKSCLQCHGPHGSDLAGVLVKPSGSLCLDCHDVKTSGFLKAHGQMKPKPDSCVSCHDPHGSLVKSMLYPVVHSPFEEGSCAPCHLGGKK